MKQVLSAAERGINGLFAELQLQRTWMLMGTFSTLKSPPLRTIQKPHQLVG